MAWKNPTFPANAYTRGRGIPISGLKVDPVFVRKLRSGLDAAQVEAVIATIARNEDAEGVAHVYDHLTQGRDSLKGWRPYYTKGGIGLDVQIPLPTHAVIWQNGVAIIPRMEMAHTLRSALHGQPLRALIDHPLLPVDDPIATVEPGPDGLVVTMAV